MQWKNAPTFKLTEILHALVAIETLLQNEITDTFRGKVSANEPELIVEYLATGEDLHKDLTG